MSWAILSLALVLLSRLRTQSITLANSLQVLCQLGDLAAVFDSRHRSILLRVWKSAAVAAGGRGVLPVVGEPAPRAGSAQAEEDPGHEHVFSHLRQVDREVRAVARSERADRAIGALEVVQRDILALGVVEVGAQAADQLLERAGGAAWLGPVAPAIGVVVGPVGQRGECLRSRPEDGVSVVKTRHLVNLVLVHKQHSLDSFSRLRLVNHTCNVFASLVVRLATCGRGPRLPLASRAG